MLDGPWSFEAWVVWPALVFLGWFAIGLLRLLRRSSHARPHLRQAALFAAGWAVAVLSLCSPLHEAGSESFSAHMLEHELLMLVAAPLLAFSRPLGVLVWALPHPARLAVSAVGNNAGYAAAWRALSSPLSATALQALALAAWHAPALFDRALASEGWHIVQHLCFIVSALLFWTAVATAADSHRRIGLAIGCLFATSVLSGLLGAFMALSSSPWYARYAALGLNGLGLTPVQDQQLAGALMWVPGGLVHLAAALGLLARRLRERDWQ